MQNRHSEGDATQAPGRQPDPECLFEGTHVRLLHHSSDGKRVIVAFGPETVRARGGDAHAVGLARRTESDLFEVVPTQPSWYPAVEMDKVCKLVNRHRDQRPASGIGASMGGYGALRYGALAGCDTVLAFSPQARISPDMRGAAAARYARHYRPDLHAQMGISAAMVPANAVVMFDPYEPHDRLQADLLHHETGVRLIALSYMGHHTEQALSTVAVAQQALQAAEAGEWTRLARVLRRGRRGAPAYLARLSQACSAREHFRWAADVADMAPSDAADRLPDLRIAIAMARAGLGHPLEALEELEALVVSAPRNLRYWKVLVDQYEAMDQMGAAADVLEIAVGETENFTFCWRLINNRIGVGALKEARAIADLAMEMWPDRRPQVQRILARIA